MKHRIISALFSVSLLISILFLSTSSSAESMILKAMLSGETDHDVSVCISSPIIHEIAQYGDDRKEELNRLLNHLSLEISLSDLLSKTTFSIEKESVFSVYEASSGTGYRKMYSFEPDLILESDSVSKEDTSSFFTFLENQFFKINRLMDDFYVFFVNSSNRFADLSKEESITLNLKNYGKAVRRITIRFSNDFVKNNFPAVLYEITDSDECIQLLKTLEFSGQQRIILLFDEDGRLLRTNYDGTVGFSDDSLHKISVNWKSLRSDGHKKDDISFKSPSVKGYNRYNFVYSRDFDCSATEEEKLNWNFELDYKSDDIRQKIRFLSDMILSDGLINGTTQYIKKQDSSEEKIQILHDMKKKSASEYEGSLEFTDYSGKMITRRISTRIEIKPADRIVIPSQENASVIRSESAEWEYANKTLENKLYSLIISRLMQLPAEDILFLTKDIPGNVLNSLNYSFF